MTGMIWTGGPAAIHSVSTAISHNVATSVGAVENGPNVAFIAVIHLPIDPGSIEVVGEVRTVAASGGGGAVGVPEHIGRLSAGVIYRGESSRMKGTMRAGIDL